MLYVTTRSKNDVFTAPITLRQDRAGDGGLFVPFRLPVIDKEQLLGLRERSFGQNVADILELFFTTKLTGWEVEMAIGRYVFQVKNMNFRVLAVELWHNIDHDMDRCVRALAKRLHPDGDVIGAPSDWTQVAVRIALLFGVFGELMRSGQVSLDKKVNLAYSAGSFAGPMAAWYGREMGLPIDTIICGCNENGAVWDLLHRGELDAGASVTKTSTPEADQAVPRDLERLVCGACGQEEAVNFGWSCTEGTIYAPSPEIHQALRKGLFAAVVSQVRVQTIIPSVYHTNRYILDLYGALAYGALMDYRSRTGKSTMTLLMSEKSPRCQAQAICAIMGISELELKKRIAEV